jgi:hypothetical protein
MTPERGQTHADPKPKGIGKKRLLTRDALDGRTRAAKAFAAIFSGIAADLGGPENLTTVERELAEAFAGAAVNVRHLNARLLVGDQIDLSEQATAISSMVRLVNHLGTSRRSRDVTPSLADIAAEISAEKHEDAA